MAEVGPLAVGVDHDRFSVDGPQVFLPGQGDETVEHLVHRAAPLETGIDDGRADFCNVGEFREDQGEMTDDHPPAFCDDRDDLPLLVGLFDPLGIVVEGFVVGMVIISVDETGYSLSVAPFKTAYVDMLPDRGFLGMSADARGFISRDRKRGDQRKTLSSSGEIGEIETFHQVIDAVKPFRMVCAVLDRFAAIAPKIERHPPVCNIDPASAVLI